MFDLALQSARIGQLVRQANCGTAIEFTNSCAHPVQIAIMYQDVSGQWAREGWWSFSSRETSTLQLTNGNTVSTNNARMYFYAEATDGSGVVWNGATRANVGARSLAMQEARSAGVNLTCNDD